MRRGKRKKALKEMDFNAIYDDTFDYEPKNYHWFCNVDSERIQSILKKNGKVTWGDVYAPWLKYRDWYEHKLGITSYECFLFSRSPDTEMKCVLDLEFGDWYWIPKDVEDIQDYLIEEELFR